MHELGVEFDAIGRAAATAAGDPVASPWASHAVPSSDHGHLNYFNDNEVWMLMASALSSGRAPSGSSGTQ